MRRIAVAASDGAVAAHFGRCQQYLLVTADQGQVQDKTTIDNPGHRPGFLPQFLAERDVDCIIAGGMGPRAQQMFQNMDIEVVVGAVGPVDDVIEQYLSAELETGEDLCDH